jgi:hypothetical protein
MSHARDVRVRGGHSTTRFTAVCVTGELRTAACLPALGDLTPGARSLTLTPTLTLTQHVALAHPAACKHARKGAPTLTLTLTLRRARSGVVCRPRPFRAWPLGGLRRPRSASQRSGR